MQILDDKNVLRRFRVSNFQSRIKIRPFFCVVPMKLNDGWNHIQLNLADFTRRVFGTKYMETIRMQVCPSCSIAILYCSSSIIISPNNEAIF